MLDEDEIKQLIISEVTGLGARNTVESAYQSLMQHYNIDRALFDRLLKELRGEYIISGAQNSADQTLIFPTPLCNVIIKKNGYIRWRAEQRAVEFQKLQVQLAKSTIDSNKNAMYSYITIGVLLLIQVLIALLQYLKTK